MNAPIVPVGLASTEVMPGMYLEINFAAGPALGSGQRRSILVITNKLSTGTATVDTEIYGPDTTVQLMTEPQMQLLGGHGSEGHRIFMAMAEVAGGADKMPPVYWLFATESAGAKAALTVTIANTATGNGTHKLWVADEVIETGVFTGDTPTNVADDIVVNVNARTYLPVTAANVAGVVTLTAKQNGPRGNQIRVQAAIVADASIATTTTRTTDTPMAGGTTNESYTTALATIQPRHFDYIVPASTDATTVDALLSQVETQAGAMTGNRQRVVAASVDSSGTGTSFANNLNGALSEVVWSEANPLTSAELAGQAAMMFAIEEADEMGFRTNFIGYGGDEASRRHWKVPAPRLTTARPSEATLRTLLAAGVSPIGVAADGSTYLVDRFTTKYLTNGQPETRIRDAHKVTICYRVADVFLARVRAAAAGKVIGDDPPDGRAPPAGMMTSRQVRMILFQVLDEFAAAAKLQNVEAIKAGSVVQRSAQNRGRMEVRCPLQPIDNFRQGAFIFDQVA